MKEETRRIMKLVQEGKLSPEDAAELIEAFSDAPDEPTTNGEQAKNESTGEAGSATASTRGINRCPFHRIHGIQRYIVETARQTT